jgi:hypothetical protein
MYLKTDKMKKKIEKKKIEKFEKKKNSYTFKSVKSPASVKENVRILKICRTSGPDVMSGRALNLSILSLFLNISYLFVFFLF